MSTNFTRGNVLKMFAVSVTMDPAAVGAATSAEQTFTVTGLRTGDIVISINKPSATAGVGIVNARVSATDTLAVTFMNATAGSVNPASESYIVLIGRPEGSLGSIFNA